MHFVRTYNDLVCDRGYLDTKQELHAFLDRVIKRSLLDVADEIYKAKQKLKHLKSLKVPTDQEEMALHDKNLASAAKDLKNAYEREKRIQDHDLEYSIYTAYIEERDLDFAKTIFKEKNDYC